MAWDILPKANLQYFLTKLKNKFLMLVNYNKLGAKNILPFPYAYGSGTVHGLTVTVNEDGSVTANGQPTQNVSFTLVSNIITEYGLQVGDKLIFSESNVENDNASAALVYVNPSGPIDLVQGDYELTVTSDMVTKGVAFILWFHSGVDLSTAVTFKPMLRLDTDPDPTWTSPAFTNRKLTELVVYLSRNKSKVVANPSTTTDILGSVTIDGTSYAIQGGGGAVTGVKGSYETDYRTGDVSVSAKNVGAFAIVGNVTVSSLDELAALCLNSGNQKAFEGPINISTDIGVGVTGWCNTLGVCLNTPGNGNSNISLFCLFMRTTGDAPKFAVINGASTGHYSVTYTGTLVKTTDLATVATSGSYNDLSNKPTIPAAQVNSNWNATSGVAQILNKPTIPTNNNQLTNGAGYQNSDGQVKSLKYSGTNTDCFTVHQTSGSFMGRSGWASYLISNHGNGASYYSQTIAIPFWGVPIYRRLEGGTDKGWKEFVTQENISSYANKTEFTTAVTNFSMSISAYSDQVVRVNAGPPSGYSALAVIGVYTGFTTVFALRWGIESGNTARIDLHNTHNAAVSGTGSVTFLCYKNS